MNWAVLVAAGRGERLGLSHNKVFAPLGGQSILLRTLEAIFSCPDIDGVVLVRSLRDEARTREELLRLPDYGKPLRLAWGGETRRESVARGLAETPEDCELVLVHDAARPLVSHRIIEEVARAAARWGCAAPGVPVCDTIKRIDGQDRVQETPDRSRLRAVQTPQAFRRELLLRAHAWGAEHMPGATDDTLLVEGLGEPVVITRGEERNLKITTPEDWQLAEILLGEARPMGTIRVGTGYDVHRLVPERRLILLGEEIPFEKGLLGHSDADVAAHALSDALLGAAGLGDIGRHFPDGDARYLNADSMELLYQVVVKLKEAGYRPHNADVTIVAQRPKLAPYLPAMRGRTADVLGIPMEWVNLKATTTEGLGFEGEGLGISAQAVVSIVPLDGDGKEAD